MIIITTEEEKQWNDIVKSFSNWDIYYLCQYSKSLELHGDGQAYLIYFEKDKKRICYIVIQKDISKFKYLTECIEADTWFDWETPYGYGGPLEEGGIDREFLEIFMEELTKYGKENHIISQFLRFHPLLENYKHWEEVFEVRHLKNTIFMDTTDEEAIMRNMDTKNRNMIRKAIKNEITIQIEEDQHIEEFISIYEKTMKKNNADNYYYFSKEYFQYIFSAMREQTKLFCAYYQGKIISAAIFFYNKNYMHYHLSGALEEYKILASMNLLLYQAAVWANHQGIQKLHLGGGVGSEDSLFHFKKQFHKNGKIDFCIGKNIFDIEKYNSLLEIRKSRESDFRVDNSFMIQYRYE